jgi:Flp pilus assembly protein TadG
MTIRRNTIYRERARRRGAAATELAILLPFIVLLLVIALDYCRVFYYSQTLRSCASCAAMYASGTVKHDPATTREDAAKEAAVREGATLSPPLKAQQVTVAIDTATATATVVYEFRTLTGYPGLPRNITIRHDVTMTRVRQPGE